MWNCVFSFHINIDMLFFILLHVSQRLNTNHLALSRKCLLTPILRHKAPNCDAMRNLCSACPEKANSKLSKQRLTLLLSLSLIGDSLTFYYSCKGFLLENLNGALWSWHSCCCAKEVNMCSAKSELEKTTAPMQAWFVHIA